MEQGIVTIFAQADLSSIPDNFWKNFSMAMVVLFLVACAAIGAWAVVRKPGATQIEQPVTTQIEGEVNVRKTARRFNYELAEQRYQDHERRIAELEEQSQELIAKLEADKNEILQAGEQREIRLQSQITSLPGKITADLLNARQLFGGTKS
jgi:TolA-binding protein